MKIVFINIIDTIKKNIYLYIYLFIYLLENNDYNEIEDDYDNEKNTDNYNRGSRSKYIYSFLFIRSTNNIF